MIAAKMRSVITVNGAERFQSCQRKCLRGQRKRLQQDGRRRRVGCPSYHMSRLSEIRKRQRAAQNARIRLRRRIERSWNRVEDPETTQAMAGIRAWPFKEVPVKTFPEVIQELTGQRRIELEPFPETPVATGSIDRFSLIEMD
jgi:hypothetical protein